MNTIGDVYQYTGESLKKLAEIEEKNVVIVVSPTPPHFSFSVGDHACDTNSFVFGMADISAHATLVGARRQLKERKG